MKKILICSIVLIILCTILVTGLSVSAVQNEVNVNLDGQLLTFDVPGRIIDGRTMVPVRGIFEALDASVDWKADTREVISKRGDDTITLAIGSSELYKNGELAYTMDVPAMILEKAGQSRTLVPVRAVAESYNCLVDWDADTKTVFITTTDNGVVLVNASSTSYVIVYDNAIEEKITSTINNGTNIVRYDIGQNIKVFSDSDYKPDGKTHEIVIGAADVGDAKKLTATLTPSQYAIKFDPSSRRVYISGGSLTDITNGVNYFFNEYADKDNKVLSVPYDLDYTSADITYTDDYEIFYGKKLRDSFRAEECKTGVYSIDDENRLFSKFECYPGSSGKIYFYQQLANVNIFDYSYYVIRYYQSSDVSRLDTCVTSMDISSVKKVYPEFTTGYYERWASEHPSGSCGEWKTAVLAKESFNNDPADALPHPDMKKQNIRFKPWYKVTPEAGDYFGVEYIALFKNKDDAETFARAIDKAQNANLPVEDFSLYQNGKSVTEAKAVVNNSVAVNVIAKPEKSVVNIDIASSDPSIIEVKNGTAIAKAEGTATLTYTANSDIEGAKIITRSIKVNVEGNRFDSIKIDGIDITDYKIVIPEQADIYTQQAANVLTDYIKVNLGISLPVITDTTSEASYEILIGNTNRAASNTGIALKDKQYLIKFKNNKLVLQGNEMYIGSAIGELINTYMEPYKDDLNITKLPGEAKAITFTGFPEKANNAILIIGDGMGFNHINATLDNTSLEFFTAFKLPVQSKAQTYSSSSSVTDSAASATAIATGYKTINGVIGLNANGIKVQNVRELAHDFGAQTAVVTNDAITGATPGGFLVHNHSRNNTEQILTDINKLLDEGKVDFAKGGVGSNLLSTTREAIRTISDTEAPFFIMIEETGNDGSGHSNNISQAYTATKRVNEVIAYATEYVLAHPDTVLVVTADHETGGLVKDETSDFGYKFTTTSHSAADVLVSAIGSGAEFFDVESVDNTDIARFIASVYGAEEFGQAKESAKAA